MEVEEGVREWMGVRQVSFLQRAKAVFQPGLSSVSSHCRGRKVGGRGQPASRKRNDERSNRRRVRVKERRMGCRLNGRHGKEDG